ncbi:uncharacterized protein UTRI_10607_B [Ustilago trichophora]|uniref:Uncharacterized protein n=1 Tax=Ustilago trichophora TaxID=86804 RepID=A0A5C3EAS1_9BASI|nr:uncharacterized protein UTRI_10607_B [Ustilago trichophora]
MRTRTTPTLLSLFSLLFTLTLILNFAASTSATPSPAVDPASVSHQPYQYFHSDGVGGSNAVCWLSREPFPPIQGVQCRFADTISQVKGRQIWQCEGDQAKFCDGCHALEKLLSDPKDLVGWKVQGC